MGTPDFATPILRALADKHEIVGVITQPDKAKGRGKNLSFSPVKELALELGFTILQPAKIATIADELTAFEADVFVVVAYGQLLPEKILNIPRLGCLNIHASLLPKYRGAAPMQWAILQGETTTGVTIMQMNKRMDAGDILLAESMQIEQMNFAELHDKLAELSCAAIIQALENLPNLVPQKQVEALVTYAPMLTKQHGIIDWNNTADRLVNQVRAFYPWPGVYTFYKGKPLKIIECAALDEDGTGVCGEITESNNRLLVKTGGGVLSISKVQGQSGKIMPVADYLRGRPMEVGEILG